MTSRNCKRSVKRRRHHQGLTLIELLVVLAIMGFLIGLILPAVASSRESARRLQCLSNLKQLGLAVQNYDATHGILPPGSSMNYSFHTFLLPFLDQAPLFQTVDFRAHPELDPTVSNRVLFTRMPVFLCPSDLGSNVIGVAPTNYFGNYGSGVQTHGFDGVFRYLQPSAIFDLGPIRTGDISDGMSSTAAIAEGFIGAAEPSRLRSLWILPNSFPAANQLDEFADICEKLSVAVGSDDSIRGRPWATGQINRTGYTHISPPNMPNCLNGNLVQFGSYSAGSAHSQGINVLFADGHVQFVARAIDRSTWRAMGSRNGSDFFSQ